MALVTCHRYIFSLQRYLSLLQAMHLITADTPHPFSNASPHCASSHCIVQWNFAPKVHSILLRQCISLETGGTRISLFATSTSGAKEGEKQT